MTERKKKAHLSIARLTAFLIAACLFLSIFSFAAMAAEPSDLTAAIDAEFSDGERTVYVLNQPDYTPETWAVYIEAVHLAIEAEAAEGLTAQQIDDAVNAILDAKASLAATEQAVLVPFAAYSVTVQTSNPKHGTVNGGGTFEEGTEVTVTAAPKAGYRLAEWLKNGESVSVSAVYTFSLTGDTALVAMFSKIEVPVITASATSYNEVTVNWNGVNGASEYEIFRATSKGGKYAKVGTTNATQFVNQVTSGKTYFYKVRVLCTAGSVTTYGALSAYKSARPLPDAPQNLSANTGPKGIELRWDASPGATKYEIYRATKPNGKFKKIKEVSDPAFTNTGLTPGMSYYYKVRVSRVDTAKAPSLYSAVAAALAPPNTPVTPKTISYPYTVTLTWKKAKGASGYDVFYSSSPLGPFEFLGNEIYQDKKNAFIDHRLETLGNTYYYAVRSYYYSSALGQCVYSDFSPAVSGTPRDFLAPSFKSKMPSVPKTNVKTVSYKIKNNGTQSLFVCDYALLIDDTSDEYNRLLDFSSSSLRKKGYQEIKPGKTGTVTFKLYSGAATRYNQFSRVAFIAGYDWELYLCMSSYFYGDTWSLVEWEELEAMGLSEQNRADIKEIENILTKR